MTETQNSTRRTVVPAAEYGAVRSAQQCGSFLNSRAAFVGPVSQPRTRTCHEFVEDLPAGLLNVAEDEPAAAPAALVNEAASSDPGAWRRG